MARSFSDEVVETSQTIGTGTYDLGGAKGSYRTFRQGYADADATLFYGVRNSDNTKWELNRNATITYGTPDRLTRGVFRSTNGDAAVSWTTDDLPLTVYVPASADVHEGAVTGWLASARHALLRAGATWWSSAAGLAVNWVQYLYNGSADVRMGIYDAVKALYFPDGRRPTTAIGAANKTVAAADIAGVFTYNTTAAARTITLPAGSTLKDGFETEHLGLSTAFGLIFTPDAGDAIDFGSAGASKTVIGHVPVRIRWDGAAGQWRTNYVTPPASDYRYRLVNGDFSIDQRNSGSSQTFTAAAAVAYCVDRWYASCTGANITGQRVAGTSPNQYAYKFTGLASNTGLIFGQRIEAANVYDLVSSDVVVSLKAKSSSITSLNWTAYYANAADDFSAKTQIATGTLTIGSSLSSQSFTFNVGANAVNGIAIEFSCGALLATQTLQLEAVQLEAGTTASSFERKSYARRFNECQRYAQSIAGIGYSESSAATGTNAVSSSIPLRARMRAAPTATSSNVSYIQASGLTLATTVDALKFYITGSSGGSTAAVTFDVLLTAEL